MSFAASEYHDYYQLSQCDLRIYLRAKGIPAAEPGAYHQLLVKLGQRHEQRHLSRLGKYFDARGDVEETRKRVARGEGVIYQPEMKAIHPEHGDVVGRPDFFIRVEGGYVIGDCKLSRRFNEGDHPEIFRQLELYGWLYQQTFGIPPARIQAYMGDGQTQIVPHQPTRALEVMGAIQNIKKLSEEPFEAIGWSKCLDCGYKDHCWRRAEATHAVGMLPGVDQALAFAFHNQKLISYDELLSKYDEGTLSEVQKEVGGKLRKVGNGARKILNHAKAFQSGEMIGLKAPDVRKAPNLVMFDVEGIPPHLDYSEKTYLWGLKVFGEKPRAYSPAVATATAEGDCDGWRKFLGECAAIFAEYGSIPFVHWSSYENSAYEVS
jgi:predicted RecB family nuclease